MSPDQHPGLPLHSLASNRRPQVFANPLKDPVFKCPKGRSFLKSRLKILPIGHGVSIPGELMRGGGKFLKKNLLRNGLGYNAKDDLELEVCLANPHMIATPKCKVPLDICLDNPQWLPLVGCSGEGLPLQVCLDFPKLLTSPACKGWTSISNAWSAKTNQSFFCLLSL